MLSQRHSLKACTSGSVAHFFIYAVQPELSGLADVRERLLVSVTAGMTPRKCRNFGAISTAFILIYDCLKTHFSPLCNALSHFSVPLSTAYKKMLEPGLLPAPLRIAKGSRVVYNPSRGSEAL